MRIGSLGIFAVLLIVGVISAAAAPATAPTRTGWQYGWLFISACGCSWVDPAKTVGANEEGVPTKENLATLYSKLGGKGNYERVLDLLNLVGQDGWELVLLQQSDRDSSQEVTYVFKRPAAD